MNAHFPSKRSRFGRLAIALLGLAFAAPSRSETPNYHLVPTSFSELPGFFDDRLEDALKVFVRTCDAPIKAPQAIEGLDRRAQAQACAAARKGEGASDPRRFFVRRFRPFLVVAEPPAEAFFTGYYQPEISGSLLGTKGFPTPVYGLPPDLVAILPQQRVGVLAGLSGARKEANGTLTPYPDRGAIEDGVLENIPGTKKLAYLRDNVDLFLAQVQGSARVRLAGGRILRLAFAGRNGQPYTALARILVQRGVASPSEMTMMRLIEWIRKNGIEKGEEGDNLLRLNRSFVFFTATFDKNSDEQPSGGSGSPMTPLRSVAVDSRVWPYGLPFFIDSIMPWRSAEAEPFRRLVIAQDTGSAIVGPARADVYFGLGQEAGLRASEIRHHGQFYVLLPTKRVAESGEANDGRR